MHDLVLAASSFALVLSPSIFATLIVRNPSADHATPDLTHLARHRHPQPTMLAQARLLTQQRTTA